MIPYALPFIMGFICGMNCYEGNGPEYPGCYHEGKMGKQVLTLSTLRKTWIFDFDGTLVEHNGYKKGEDRWLPGAEEFLRKIPEEDYVLILTGREKEAEEQTVRFLEKNHIRYDRILFEIPLGERILFNDDKPSGLRMAYAVAPARNEGLENTEVMYDASL